ncbi:MAG TPA: hypothetical protein VKE98_21130 [Gemmataceae bacterium]|nr:hypothetical protein [Gemmataceae bacterium]
MVQSAPSALVIDQGSKALFRINGKFYELTQKALRLLLGLPQGPAGLGITIDRNRFRFEFTEDNQEIELTTDQLKRRLSKQVAAKK